jgi:hypothetical protein
VTLFETVMHQVCGDREPGSPSWVICAREVIRAAADYGDEEVTAAMSGADPEALVLALSGDWDDSGTGDEVVMALAAASAPSPPARAAAPRAPTSPAPRAAGRGRVKSVRRHAARQAQLRGRFRRGRGRLT